MWIFIWFLLSAILIGASVWSYNILMRQKKAWEIFAKARNFTFVKGTSMGPAEMSGVIGDYKLAFFTAERQDNDIRNKRYLTVVEFDLVEGLFNGGVAGTKEMLPFMQSLVKLKPYTVDLSFWDKADHFMFMQNEAASKAYLTPERLETINTILKTRNADCVVIFNDQQIVIRLETTDPMQDAEKIDKIVKRIMALCDKLRIAPEERKALNAKPA